MSATVVKFPPLNAKRLAVHIAASEPASALEGSKPVERSFWRWWMLLPFLIFGCLWLVFNGVRL